MPDPAAELCFALLQEAAVLLAAEHGLPVGTVHPGSHGLLRHGIEDPRGLDVGLLHGVGLLHDLDSLVFTRLSMRTSPLAPGVICR